MGRRQRPTDIDNAIAATKAWQDGIFDALGIDDSRITEIAMRQERATTDTAAHTVTIRFLS